MAEIVRLRGHHLLCLLGFRGLGYSDGFVRNMARIHERVTSVGVVIEIVQGADDICAACPRLKEGRCSSEEGSRVDVKDTAILDLLRTTPGERVISNEIRSRIADAIAPADLARICSRCQWLELGYCQAGLAQIAVQD